MTHFFRALVSLVLLFVIAPAAQEVINSPTITVRFTYSLLPPPTSSYTKFFGPMKPESNEFYLVPVCEKKAYNWKKTPSHNGSIQFWSLDRKRLVRNIDWLTVTDWNDLKRYRFDASLYCSSGAEQPNSQVFPRVPPRRLEDQEKNLGWDKHIWGECPGEKKKKGTFETVVPGTPVLEYHRGESKDSPILWQVDLGNWPLPNGTHLSCGTWQDLSMG